jgi:hypothetical protein
MENLKTHKFSFGVLVLLVLFLAALFSTSLIKNESDTKVNVEKTSVEESDGTGVTVEEGNNSTKVQVNNQIKSEQTSQTNPNPGTCTVTRNGVVTIVPADQVNVKETGNGDKNVKVVCNNSSSSSTNNGNNQTTIDNKVNIQVKTSD